jgi:hypothetical protein
VSFPRRRDEQIIDAVNLPAEGRQGGIGAIYLFNREQFGILIQGVLQELLGDLLVAKFHTSELLGFEVLVDNAGGDASFHRCLPRIES